MPTVRIFVIDNDQQTITDLKSRFSQPGFDVVGTATTSREAIEKNCSLAAKSYFDEYPPSIGN